MVVIWIGAWHETDVRPPCHRRVRVRAYRDNVYAITPLRFTLTIQLRS